MLNTIWTPSRNIQGLAHRLTKLLVADTAGEHAANEEWCIMNDDDDDDDGGGGGDYDQ